MVFIFIIITMFSWISDARGFQRESKNGWVHEHWRMSDGLPMDSLTGVAVDGAGFLWIGTFEGLARFDGRFFRIYDRSRNPILKSNLVKNLISDKDRVVYFNAGDSCYRIRDFTIEVFSCVDFDLKKKEYQGHCRNDVPVYANVKKISCSHKDINGNYWISTIGDGLHRIYRGKINVSDSKLTIRTIAIDKKGYLWAARPRVGICVKSTLEAPCVPVNLECKSDKSLEPIVASVNDEIFGSCGDTLYKLSAGSFVKVISFRGQAINSIYGLRDNLYVSTRGNVFKVNNSQAIQISLLPHKDTIITSMLQVGKKLYAGTWGRGLYEISLETGRATPFAEVTDLYIEFISEYEKYVSVGTKNGIFFLNKGKTIHISSKNGLADNSVFSWIKDHKGYIWSSGNRGIFRYAERDILNFLKGKNQQISVISSFNESDGMESAECTGVGLNTALIYNNNVLFSTVAGIVRIDLNSDLRKAFNPVSIISIAVNGVERKISKSVKLDSPDDRLDIEFVSPFAPWGTDYQIRLRKHHKNIRRSGNNLSLTGFGPGQFRLEISLDYYKKRISDNSVEISIIRKQKVFESIYFRIVVVIIFLTLLSIIVMHFSRTEIKKMGSTEVTFNSPNKNSNNPSGDSVAINECTNSKKQESEIDSVNAGVEDSKPAMEEKYGDRRLNRDQLNEIEKSLNSVLSKLEILTDADLTVRKLARLIHIKQSDLSQFVNVEKHMSFSNYISFLRVELVKKKMREGDVNILEIAMESGFTSKSSFNAQFKKHTGMTPSEWRDKYC
ncbi:helix-turn-helix domain-containing protein [Myxococcota bacterium]|nr:helix-turn-helix domain-containing protein [Myxococcota bacterium]MBU1379510.1 helix-turn-helix domain-containing protein [Myxococcota bacterium]MBU1495725.1 helix-turn-helix domain-containing protein [Myxococcota bacterium]